MTVIYLKSKGNCLFIITAALLYKRPPDLYITEKALRIMQNVPKYEPHIHANVLDIIQYNTLRQ